MYWFSYHGGVGVRGKQLHVDHPVDGSLAVAVVVLTYLGLHFGRRFLELFLNKNGTKIELCGGFVGSVQVSEVSVRVRNADELSRERDEREVPFKHC